MDMYPKYISPFGYQTNDGKIDSYGVDHSGFTTRDELEYQFARDKREQDLMKQYNAQGITSNYPQYGTTFGRILPITMVLEILMFLLILKTCKIPHPQYRKRRLYRNNRYQTIYNRKIL